MSQMLISALRETLYMLIAAGLLSILVGLPLGIITAKTTATYSVVTQWLHALLLALLQGARSIPYLLLMLLFIPITNWLINRGISYTTATILPLGVAGGVYLANEMYQTLLDLNEKWRINSKLMGASKQQVFTHIILPEAVWPLLQYTSNTWAMLVGFTIIAGALGAGGLGQLAIEQSINNPNPLIVILSIVLLVALQQLFKYTGSLVAQHTR